MYSWIFNFYPNQFIAIVGPLHLIILAQIFILFIIARFLFFPLMGKDYDVAVMTGGFVGVMLRNTANAIANVESLNEKVGL